MFGFQAVYCANSQGLYLPKSASPLAGEQCSVDGSIDRPDFPLLSSEEHSGELHCVLCFSTQV